MNFLIILITTVLVTAGCTNVSGGAYRQAEVGQRQRVDYGTVTQVRSVLIQGTEDEVPVGTVAGAIIGGTVGSSLGGRSTTRTIGGVAGAVAGGVAGRALQGQISQQEGLEIEVQLDRGGLIALTQGADQPFTVGDRVRVITGSNGRSRVTR